MIPLLAIGRSMRRSHARRYVLLAVHDLGSSDLARIAERARQTPARTQAVLHGKMPGFRPELSLLALELVRTTDDARYEITPRGQLVVRSLGPGGLKLLVEGPIPPTPREARRLARETCPACGHRRGEVVPEAAGAG